MNKNNLTTATKNLKKSEMRANFKCNWYFPFLAMAYLYLAKYDSLAYYIGMPIAFIVMIAVSKRTQSFWNLIKDQSIIMKLLCGTSALGICIAYFNPISKEITGTLSLGIASVTSLLFNYLIFFAAICFVYICLTYFWRTITDLFQKCGVFEDISKAEIITYTILIILSISLSVFAFAQSEAFYGTEMLYDIIYTSDSPSLVKGNVYLTLTHPENDLRQPLFAVFAAPFVGIPYLVGELFGSAASIQAMLLNGVQIILLFATNYMVAKMMKLKSKKRILFILLTSCTYTYLLFTLMLEQYIFAYFYLILSVYLIAENQSPAKIVLWGAGGTLLTSMVLLPFASGKSLVSAFKEWLRDTMKNGVGFVILLLAFCRFDIIFFLMAKVEFLERFTGQGLTITEKLNQYIEFVCNCFVAPAAGESITNIDNLTYPSWQLEPITNINVIGVAILILVILSAIMNKNKKSSLLAAGWIVFSVIMLLVLGWGTQENGLILYSLYFGWAFFVLLFQLVEKIEEKINIKFITQIVSVGAIITLAAINIPAIMEMVNFAISRYPI